MLGLFALLGTEFLQDQRLGCVNPIPSRLIVARPARGALKGDQYSIAFLSHILPFVLTHGAESGNRTRGLALTMRMLCH